MNKFVLLTSQRSGSTFTRLLLNSHPQIRLYSEVFHIRYRPKDGFKHHFESNVTGGKFLLKLISGNRIRRPGRKILKSIRDKQVLSFLNELENSSNFPQPWTDISDDSWLNEQSRVEQQQPCKAIGFQLMYSTIEKYPTVCSWLDESNTRIVHMYRENLLKKHLSIITSKTALMAAHFNLDGKKRTARLNPETLMDNLQRLADNIEWARQTYKNRKYMEFSYEGFFSDKERIMAEVMDFLDVEPTQLIPPEYLKKLNSNKLSDAIENYDEVKEVLTGTRFENMLE